MSWGCNACKDIAASLCSDVMHHIECPDMRSANMLASLNTSSPWAMPLNAGLSCPVEIAHVKPENYRIAEKE